MKQYCCPKCGSMDVFLKDSGSQKGLYCSEGCGWIKWIGKKELPLVERFIEDNKVNSSSELITSYGIMTLKDCIKQKKQEVIQITESGIIFDEYNRGILNGLTMALNIMEGK
jgi:hypothetical protein